RLLESGFEPHRAVVRRRYAHLLQIAFSGRLQPHGLPYAGGAGVKDTARLGLPVLLSPRDIAVRGRIFGAHRNRVAAGFEQRSNVKLEWRVPSRVLSGQLPVDPDRGPVIDGAEVEKDSTAFPGFGERDGAPVPDPGMERGIADAAQRALKAER